MLVLVDGPHKIKRLAVEQEAVVRGDARSLSIAAASIFAKVLRDRWMERLDSRYPGYGLAAHKGYGTAAHLAALGALGPSGVHRFSFAPVKMANAKSEFTGRKREFRPLEAVPEI
jgi:ribonuclease HII